ncbi:MAG: hypothetical protein FGM24_09230 [Candidatus Kapabacteria bacterium]|nr:hypothetical protein [Candidatus Kapabacteria bacterium]
MPRYSPVTERLRETCVEAIDKLVLNGKAASVRAAAAAVYKSSRQRHAPTGFRMDDFQRFYWAVVKWQQRRRRQNILSA